MFAHMGEPGNEAMLDDILELGAKQSHSQVSGLSSVCVDNVTRKSAEMLKMQSHFTPNTVSFVC